ncbi:MAG: hypothetical protein JW991_01965 [Candidatus Pacebacteria bacterium]|nr:hypothetical protein [Candidatus Paceibacterota bacterium]
MKKLAGTVKILSVFGGLCSSFLILGGYFFLETFRPRMILFETLTPSEEFSLNYVGVGLLFLLAFFLISFFRVLEFLKDAKRISFARLFLLALSVLAFIFVFGDFALLSDINKQYRHGLAQPEWPVLYLVMGGQLISVLILTIAHLLAFRKKRTAKVEKDINVFMIAQYLGLFCGTIGFCFIVLNFFFPRPLWMIKLHVSLTSIFFLMPYVLTVGFWLLIKIREKGAWLDEKQFQDVGRASFLTLIVSLPVMSFLFFWDFFNPNDVLSALWFPFYALLNLALFSFFNLYQNRNLIGKK